MKTITNTISAHFTCDACKTESATSDGVVPSGWKEIIKTATPLTIKVKLCIGPTCLASTDPAVLTAIKNVLIS